MLAQRMGLSTLRTPQHVLQKVRAALLPTAQVYLGQVLWKGSSCPPYTPGPPDLFIGHLPRETSPPPPNLSHPYTTSRLHDLQLVHFRTVPRKHLYTLMLHILHFLTLVSRSNMKWQDLLPPVEGGPTYILPQSQGPPGILIGGSSTKA
ncbi:unnamed protein product [Lepidochelys olivacea]